MIRQVKGKDIKETRKVALRARVLIMLATDILHQGN